LKEYCYRVRVRWGDLHPHFWIQRFQALDLAEKLGLAFQLTNIILARARRTMPRKRFIILPEEDLARYGVADRWIWMRRSGATLGVRGFCV